MSPTVNGPRTLPQVHKTFVALRPDGSAIRFPALSPDGRKIVYAARSRLWVQALDEWEPRELAGTEGGVRPFWSPASDWIGFFRNEQLLKIPAAGGPVVSIATLPAVQAPLFSSSAVWNDDGTIFLSQAAGPQIYRVPGGGGELKAALHAPGRRRASMCTISRLCPAAGWSWRSIARTASARWRSSPTAT